MKVTSTVKIDEVRLKKLLENQPQAKMIQVKDFTEGDEEAEILLTYGWDIQEETLGRFPNLRWIQTLSAGVDMLPLDKLAENKVILTNVKGAHKIPMAEHVIWSMLMLLRQGVTFVSQQEKKVFSAKPKLDEMYKKTVCVIGAGTIGCEIAKRCEAFGMNVVGVSRRGEQDSAFSRIVSVENMAELLKQSDIVVVVLPLTSETRNFVNADFINKMKDGAVLVNAARGPVVDERALLNALQSKKIKAAALDVFVQEPLPEDSPFWELENVFITPHIGGRTNQIAERMWDVFTINFAKYPDLAQMMNVIDLSAGY